MESRFRKRQRRRRRWHRLRSYPTPVSLSFFVFSPFFPTSRLVQLLVESAPHPRALVRYIFIQVWVSAVDDTDSLVATGLWAAHSPGEATEKGKTPRRVTPHGNAHTKVHVLGRTQLQGVPSQEVSRHAAKLDTPRIQVTLLVFARIIPHTNTLKPWDLHKHRYRYRVHKCPGYMKIPSHSVRRALRARETQQGTKTLGKKSSDKKKWGGGKEFSDVENSFFQGDRSGELYSFSDSRIRQTHSGFGS